MTNTLHTATLTNFGRKYEGFVVCVDGKPLIAVDKRGKTLHGVGREQVAYSAAAIVAPEGFYLDELAEDFGEIEARTPLTGVTFTAI